MKEKVTQFTSVVMNRPILLVILGYTISWIATGTIGWLFWHDHYPPVNAILYFAFFFIPLIPVVWMAWWGRNHANPFRWLTIIYGLGIVFIILNQVVLKIPLQNYGDVGYLDAQIGAGRIFARWFLGSSLLKSVYASLIVPFIQHKIFPEDQTPAIFLRIFNSIWIFGFSIYLIWRHPNRLMVILPISIPIWFLFGSGYSEYYPIIAPAYLLILMVLFEIRLEDIHPCVMGVIIAATGLSYAGFLPNCVFLGFIYFWRVGFKKTVLAGVYTIIWVVLLTTVFWPDTITSYFKTFNHTLNLGDINSPPKLIGQTLAGTPFYKPQFGLTLDNFKRMVNMQFWGGGLVTVLALLVTIIVNMKTGITGFVKKNWFAIIILAYQAFFFMFKVPKLGYNDIDLNFQVFFTFAFLAGYYLDAAIERRSLEKNHINTFIYSLMAGNTAYILLFLVYLGFPHHPWAMY